MLWGSEEEEEDDWDNLRFTPSTKVRKLLSTSELMILDCGKDPFWDMTVFWDAVG